MNLRGRTVLITSGPTREFIDPIRFLTNSSSGAMGWALAAAARLSGASVVVISGPTLLAPPPGIRVVFVTTALEMWRETMKRSSTCDVVIGAAAVCDWRVSRAAIHKIKRSSSPMRLTLIPNPDIIKDAAVRRRPGQIFVGFALETCRSTINARRKLRFKGLDLVIANGIKSLASKSIKATMVAKDWTRLLPSGSKSKIAKIIVAEIARQLNEDRNFGRIGGHDSRLPFVPLRSRSDSGRARRWQS